MRQWWCMTTREWPQLTSAKAEQLAMEIMARCDQLATISQQSDAIDRRYLTAEHQQANAQVSDWLEAAGLDAWQDGAGNIWGRKKATTADAKTLVLGSHLDTVPNAGRYDGILGTLTALYALQWLQQQSLSLPFNIDMVGFADEEGTRFGTTLLGSRAVAGGWPSAWYESLVDHDGIALAQALTTFGSDREQIAQANRATEKLLGYVELHIEQGPVLEQQQLPLGVVTGIAGARRFQVKLTGMAGHAGTVPMPLRRDALAGAAELILFIEQTAQQTAGLVATVGAISAAPGAVNVIAGDVELSLDVRSEQDTVRDTAIEEIQTQAKHIAERRALTLDWQQTHQAPAVTCDESLTQLLSEAVTCHQSQCFALPSGAGHDAMAMAQICPVGMLFMRCKGGISHHPAESVTTGDVAQGLQTMLSFLRIYAAACE